MRIIDPHVHVWKNDPKFPWAKETINPPKDDATPEMLLDLMNKNGVEKTVLVQVIHYRWDNSFVSHTVRKYPHKFVGVGRINPEDPSAADHLSYWVEEHGLQGMRLSPSIDSSGDWFSRPDLMGPIFSRAETHNIPILILTKPKRLPDLTNILDQYNDEEVVDGVMVYSQFLPYFIVGAVDKDGNEISINWTNVNAWTDPEEYKYKRAEEYPSIVDQLDEIYHNGIDSWKAVIKKTKDKYPKG